MKLCFPLLGRDLKECNVLFTDLTPSQPPGNLGCKVTGAACAQTLLVSLRDRGLGARPGLVLHWSGTSLSPTQLFLPFPSLLHKYTSRACVCCSDSSRQPAPSGLGQHFPSFSLLIPSFNRSIY